MVISLKEKQSGMTLIELLIAMLIGTLLILGATSMFIANKRVYKEVDFQGRLAENARFGMEMMIRDLRMAGFMGCAVQQGINNRLDVLNTDSTQNKTNLLSYITKNSSECSSAGLTDANCDQANSIEGFDNTDGTTAWNPSGSTDPTDADVVLVNNTDGFTVRFMEDTNANLCADMNSSTDEVQATSQSSTISIGSGVFVQGGVYGVGDCEATNIFQLVNNDTSEPFSLQHSTGGTFSPGNQESSLSKIYTTGSAACATPSAASPVDIFIFRARRYFIATEAAIDGGRPALYRQTFDTSEDSDTPTVHSERLIDGVENMQILFGEDVSSATQPLDRVADEYKKAIDVDNWENVVSVKIAVLFSTVEQDFSAPLDTDTYQLLDEAAFDPTPGADDHRRRKILEATVSLRNRQLSI